VIGRGRLVHCVLRAEVVRPVATTSNDKQQAGQSDPTCGLAIDSSGRSRRMAVRSKTGNSEDMLSLIMSIVSRSRLPAGSSVPAHGRKRRRERVGMSKDRHSDRAQKWAGAGARARVAGGRLAACMGAPQVAAVIRAGLARVWAPPAGRLPERAATVDRSRRCPQAAPPRLPRCDDAHFRGCIGLCSNAQK